MILITHTELEDSKLFPRSPPDEHALLVPHFRFEERNPFLQRTFEINPELILKNPWNNL